MSTGNLDTYTMVGAKEDVSDVISNISPTLTPFQTMIGSDKIHQRLHQWQEDSLLSVAVNAQIEGATAPSATWQATVMRSNTTQIFSKTAATTGTTDVTETYGRGKEMAYQLDLRAKELKRDFENALVGTRQSSVTGNSTSIARTFAGVQAQIAAGATTNVGANSGSLAALTETSVVTNQQLVYNLGADPSVLMVKPNDKLKLAALKSTGRTDYVADSTKKIVNAVDVYESPFGEVRVVMNRFIAGGPLATFTTYGDALMFDPAQWKKLVLRNWFRQTLAVTGDAKQIQILGEFSLAHKNFNASGLMTFLSA